LIDGFKSRDADIHLERTDGGWVLPIDGFRRRSFTNTDNQKLQLFSFQMPPIFASFAVDGPSSFFNGS